MLSLDAPLDRVVPELREWGGRRVRLHHLLTHTSGTLRAGARRAGSAAGRAAHVPDRTSRAGTATRYSSLAFEGVRLLVEDATGHQPR